MKIALTGSSGRIGGLLTKTLENAHEVVSLGRKNCSVSWSLGFVPSPESLQGVEAIIHCAWSTSDRKRDYHLNVGGTGTLANYARANNIPFLFLSSVAAESDSFYGRAKLEAENLVSIQGGSILRIGLVPDLNPYFHRTRRLIGLAPQIPGYINVTEFQLVGSWVTSWLDLVRTKGSLPELETIVSSSVSASEQFSKLYKIAIPFPVEVLRVVLKFSSQISLESANMLDALDSLNTTPRHST